MLLATFNEAQKHTFFHLAHNLVVSDGVTAPGEHAMMEEMRREMDLPADLESHYVEPTGMEDIFDTRRARVICLLSLLRLAYADGAFEIEELGFLSILRRAFGISETDFQRIDNWVRRLVALETEVQGLF